MKTIGFLFKIFGTTVCWSIKKHSTVISSTEAAREGIWLLNLLTDFGSAKSCFKIYEHNQSCIKLVNK